MYGSLKGINTTGMAALIAMTWAEPAMAQRTTTASKPAAKAPAAKERRNKWVFGAHTIATPGVSITGPDFEEWPVSTTMGGGLGIMAGYELNRAHHSGF